MIGRRQFIAGALGTVAATRLLGAESEVAAPAPGGLLLAKGNYATFEEKWLQVGPDIAIDSSRFSGGPSLRMTSTDGRAAGAECILGPPPSRLLQLDVYVEDPGNCTVFQMLLTTNGDGWLATANKYLTLVRGWNRLQFSVQDCMPLFKAITRDDWDHAGRVRLYFQSKPGTTATIWVARIVWLRTRAAVTFTFDDGRRGGFENALPIMASHGWAATMFVVTDGVGRRSFQLADSTDVIEPLGLDELYELQDNGWDIASHTCTHRDLVKASSAEKQYEMEASKAWLVQNGFSSGARFFATPYGRRDAETQAIASRLYETLRDTSSSTGYETPLNMNFAVNTRYQLRNQVLEVLSRTSPQKFKSWIDTAIETGTWLILSGHSVDNSAGWLDPDVFRRYLGYLEVRRSDIDVLPMSQYWDRRNRSVNDFATNGKPAVPADSKPALTSKPSSSH